MAAAQEPVRGMELSRGMRRLRRPVPAPILHGVRGVIRRYAVLTAEGRPLPDFLIIGAKKAGTSSLMNWLVRHPCVARMFPSAQRLKSPHYFDINYARGRRWYASHFPTRRARRSQDRRTGHLSVTGEASPYYMFHPAAPGRVRATLPDAKVIVLLRDPVSRAYSNYWDRRAAGAEDLPTFEAALAAEEGRLAGADAGRLTDDPSYYSFDHDNHSYLARGRYHEHLQPWLDLLPPQQLCIVRAEDMFADPLESFASILGFLGIPPVTTSPLRPYNERPRPQMTEATRRELADYYRPHNAALYEAIGRDMGWEARYPD